MSSAPPPAPPPLTLDLNQYADAVNNAFYNQTVCVIATSNGSDVDLALKGSFMVWDKDHLAYWERGLNETLAAIRARGVSMVPMTSGKNCPASESSEQCSTRPPAPTPSAANARGALARSRSISSCEISQVTGPSGPS